MSDLPRPGAPSGTPTPDPVAAEVADLVHTVARTLRRQANADLGPLGLTAGPARALRALARHDAPVRMGALAAALGIAPRSATEVVEVLVAKGLARRCPDPDDGRAVVVALTPEGRRRRAGMDERRRQALADRAVDLSPADLASLRDLLRRLLPPPPPC